MTPRNRRALVIGGAIVLTAFVGLRAGPWAWYQVHKSLERLRMRAEFLAHAQAEVRNAKMLEDSAKVIRVKLMALAPKILVGGTSPEAFADLTSRLIVIAERHRIRIERTDLMPDSTQGNGLRRVSMRGAIEGDTRGTLGFLDALATEAAILTVDQVRFVAPDPGSPGAAAEVLRTELTVRGWYLSREHRS